MPSGPLAHTDVVVLAGGLGTRIQPVLGDVPKLLAPIGERTYLDYLCDWLQGFGATRVILSLGHQAHRIVEYISLNPRPEIVIDTVIEDKPMGTAGALRLVRPAVKSELALVMNGDSWIGADLGEFLTASAAKSVPASLLCVRVEDAGRYGRVDISDEGRILAFEEKKPDAGPGLINAGVYVFGQDAWEIIGNSTGPSLERDVFQSLSPSTLAAYDAGDVPFIDIGTPESLGRAAAIIGQNTPYEETS